MKPNKEFANPTLNAMIEDVRTGAKPSRVESLVVPGWNGATVEDDLTLIAGLERVQKLENECKKFRKHCKEYVDQHGPVVDKDGRRYERAETKREIKCNMSIAEIGQLMTDLRFDEILVREFAEALKQRKIGEYKVVGVYRWSK